MFPKSLAAAILLIAAFLTPAFAAQSVNINSATAATIAENLNGIGEAKARAIIEYRTEHGNFVDEQDLIKVKGIGAKLIERNRSLISFGKKAGAAKPVAGSTTADAKKPAGTKAVETGAQPQLSN
jgi:competence protein ComEA